MEQIERSVPLAPRPGLHLARQHSLDGLVRLFTLCTYRSLRFSLSLSRSIAASLSLPLFRTYILSTILWENSKKRLFGTLEITCRK